MDTERGFEDVGLDSRETSDEQLVTGRHSAHFLQRLDRLPSTQVELALALYRDDELVKSLLGALEVGDRVERVAISLNDVKRGPFVVVTRDGHFVTCLGEGMHAGDTPVVTKERFERVTRDVQRIRNLKAEIARHPRREAERAMSRLLSCGSQLSREEFSTLAAWQPLMAPMVMDAFLQITAELWTLHEKLIVRENQFKSRDEPVLNRFWKDAWATMHLQLLLGVDGGQFFRRALEIQEAAPKLLSVFGETLRLNALSQTVRSAWLAAKIGKPMMAPTKQLYQSPHSELSLYDAGIVLSVMGHGHRKLQAEISKVLAQSERVTSNYDAEYVRAAHRVFSKHFDLALKKPEVSRACLALVATESCRQIASFLPLESCVALLLQKPVAVISLVAEGFADVLSALPWVAKANAADFYLPQSQLNFVAEPWTLEQSILLMEPSRNYYKLRRTNLPPLPKRVRPPGRNERCPCGSQKKYKHCCALKG